MAIADDEIAQAIQGLDDAGAAVNAGKKPVKPIRETKKKTTAKKEEEDPNAGLVTFAEEDQGPFLTPPALTVDDVEGSIEEALDNCGVGYVPEQDEPNVAGEGLGIEAGECDGSKVMAIRSFAMKTRAIYTTSPATPQEKTYGTQKLWNYIIAINNCHTRVLKISEQARGNSADMKIERDVYCLAELIDNETNEVLTRTIMTAATDEDFISKQQNPLSCAYGLAQTRAEERLARMIFGWQAVLAGLEPTPAEELDVVEKWWGNKDKEL